MKQEKPSSLRRWLRNIGLSIFLIIGLIVVGSALSNLLFSSRSEVVDRLSDMEKTRLAEIFHLRRTLGDTLWPGWGQADIPIIVYNEEYAFLVGYQNPPDGWMKVPQNIHRGGPWKPVPDDVFAAQPYYRQRLDDKSALPEAFTVRVGERWVASMTTKEWTAIGMGNEMRDGLPSVLRLIVPYRLISKFFAPNTDGYICALEHESFHAYQGKVASTRLAEAENVLTNWGSYYPWEDEACNNDWKIELNLLADALKAKTDAEMIELARKFITKRQERRLSHGLSNELLNVERQREWGEGLAKYTELAMWRLAGTSADYRPLSNLTNDSGFNSYKAFARQWVQEVMTIRFQTRGDEIRFYYSGMAQAFLLDRLMPEWKARVWQENAFLEDLLNEAINRKLSRAS